MTTTRSVGRPLSPADGQAAVYGGAILGGGGGGSIEAGLEMVRAAFATGRPCLASPDDLAPDDQVVTVGLVGSPASPGARVVPADHARAVRLLQADLAQDGRPAIAGFIANENGAVASVNGWLQAATLGLPVVDAPCDGRAHPTALMGALGLHLEPAYRSRQAAAGGDKVAGLYVEMTVQGGLDRASAAVRQAAVQAGGLVAVARNPVPVSRAKSHGAPGAISQAIDVGRAFLGAGPSGVAALFAAPTILTGRVRDVELKSQGGFDVGSLTIDGEAGATYRIAFWNEFGTLEEGAGRRFFTFPDLIAVFDLSSGRPLTSGDVRPGEDVRIMGVRRAEIKVGAAVLDPDLRATMEQALGKILGG